MCERFYSDEDFGIGIMVFATVALICIGAIFAVLKVTADTRAARANERIAVALEKISASMKP